jgi:regulatory protein
MKPEKALQIITAQCSRKEYCSSDILEKLHRWELQAEEIQKIMEFLYQYKFIDDTRFANSYAEDKFRFNHWGKQKIALMLQRKRIKPELIEQALKNIESDTYQKECKTLLSQKMRTIHETDPYKLKAKLIRYGAGRGFDFDTLHYCLSQLLTNNE